MTQAVNTIIDKGLYDMYTSPLYQRINLREQDIYTEILPIEYKTNIPAATDCPSELNFVLPAKDYANVIQSALNFQIGVPFTAGDLSGKTVIQQNCAIYVCPSADLVTSSTKVLKCRLPLQTQCFFTEVQVEKDNIAYEGLNLKQEHKFRENLFARLTSQEFINRTGADNVLCNDNTKIIFIGAATNDTTTMVYLNFVFPLANISPLFAVWPYFPFELLNKDVRLKLTLNQKAFNIVGTNFVNFVMKM